MLFKNKKGEIVVARNDYEANILMSNKDYTPFENEEKPQNNEENVIFDEKIEENAPKIEKTVQKSSKKKDGE